MDQNELDALVWDLLPVSKEEFQEKLNNSQNYEARMDFETDQDYVYTHYTDQDGLYLGSIRFNDDGTEYMLADEASD